MSGRQLSSRTRSRARSARSRSPDLSELAGHGSPAVSGSSAGYGSPGGYGSPAGYGSHSQARQRSRQRSRQRRSQAPSAPNTPNPPNTPNTPNTPSHDEGSESQTPESSNNLPTRSRRSRGVGRETQGSQSRRRISNRILTATRMEQFLQNFPIDLISERGAAELFMAEMWFIYNANRQRPPYFTVRLLREELDGQRPVRASQLAIWDRVYRDIVNIEEGNEGELTAGVRTYLVARINARFSGDTPRQRRDRP